MNSVHIVVDPDMQNGEWKLVSQRPDAVIYDDLEETEQAQKIKHNRIDDIFRTVENMEAYGGSFVKQLAELARRADPTNLKKIQNTWPEYWEKYSRDF